MKSEIRTQIDMHTTLIQRHIEALAAMMESKQDLADDRIELIKGHYPFDDNLQDLAKKVTLWRETTKDAIKEAREINNVNQSKKGMNLAEIKTAIAEGKNVYWASLAYQVKIDKYNQYIIVCSLNGNAIGLTWQDGTTLNGKETDFFIK